jgi:predicted Fe-Mo cluster-binding NifX family protein
MSSMKIAIPSWEGRVSPVLDSASNLLVIEVRDQREVGRSEHLIADNTIAQRCNMVKALGIDRIICGAVSNPFGRMLASSGIKLYPGITGAVEEVLQAFLNGTLNRDAFFLPGYDKKSHSGLTD